MSVISACVAPFVGCEVEGCGPEGRAQDAVAFRSTEACFERALMLQPQVLIVVLPFVAEASAKFSISSSTLWGKRLSIGFAETLEGEASGSGLSVVRSAPDDRCHAVERMCAQVLETGVSAVEGIAPEVSGCELVVVSCCAAGPEDHRRIGTAIGRLARERDFRAVVVALGNLAERDGDEFSPEARLFNETLQSALCIGDFDALFDFSPSFLRFVDAPGLKSMQLLSGVVRGPWTAVPRFQGESSTASCCAVDYRPFEGGSEQTAPCMNRPGIVCFADVPAAIRAGY